MNWFVDKLGPAPSRNDGRRPDQPQAQRAPQQAQRAAASTQPPKAAPEPEKKKKKGWF